MMVGHGSVRLEVPDGTPLGGYADRIGGATGTLDPLQVSALVFSQEGTAFAFLVCDVVCVNSDLAADILASLQSMGIPAGWVCATHTHSGPDTGCHPGGAATPHPWRRTITRAAIHAVRAAQSTRTVVSFERHACVVGGVAGIRSLPGTPMDVPVDVIVARDALGRMRGLLVVLPIHSTVLPASNNAVSGDLIGRVRAHLERTTGAWVVVAAGAAGDISTRHGRRAQTSGELDRLSVIIGEEVRRAIARQPSEVTGPAAQVKALRRKLIASAMSASARDSYIADALNGFDPTDQTRPRLTATLQQALQLSADIEVDRELSIDVAVLGLGEIILCAVAGEPFLASAAQLRNQTGRDTLLLGYVNGYRGYLPTTDRFPVPGYEVLASPVERGTAERVVEELAQMVAELTALA